MNSYAIYRDEDCQERLFETVAQSKDDALDLFAQYRSGYDAFGDEKRLVAGPFNPSSRDLEG